MAKCLKNSTITNRNICVMTILNISSFRGFCRVMKQKEAENKMENMKENLFSYTKKELELDAIIRWILENSNIEHGEKEGENLSDLAYFGRRIIKEIIKKASGDAINFKEGDWIKTVAQARDIDVFVIGRFGGKYYKFVIEDKIFSFLRDAQLTTYLVNANGWYRKGNKENDDDIEEADYQVIPVFIKLYLISIWERKKVVDQVEKAKTDPRSRDLSNLLLKPVIFDLDDFYDLFKTEREIKNQTLKEYILTLKEKADVFFGDRDDKEIRNEKIELTENSDFSLSKWRKNVSDLNIMKRRIFLGSVFNSFVESYNHSLQPKPYRLEFGDANTYGYSWIKICKKDGKYKDYYPSIEMRGRDIYEFKGKWYWKFGFNLYSLFETNDKGKNVIKEAKLKQALEKDNKGSSDEELGKKLNLLFVDQINSKNQEIKDSISSNITFKVVRQTKEFLSGSILINQTHELSFENIEEIVNKIGNLFNILCVKALDSVFDNLGLKS